MKSREKKPLNCESILTITDFFDSLKSAVPIGTALLMMHNFELHRIQHRDEQRQQDKRSGDPLGHALELRIQRRNLAAAEEGVGAAGQRTHTIALAGLQQDNNRQCDAGDELKYQKNNSQSCHEFTSKISYLNSIQTVLIMLA